MKKIIFTALTLAIVLTPAFADDKKETKKAEQKPRIEVCFVLDTHDEPILQFGSYF